MLHSQNLKKVSVNVASPTYLASSLVTSSLLIGRSALMILSISDLICFRSESESFFSGKKKS